MVRWVGTPWVWMARVRHRCGYGVHSPFAFNFITGVVYERGTYYAYRQLDRLYGPMVRWLHLRPRKCGRLLFRLANYVHPAAIVTWRASDTVRAWLAGGCAGARLVEWPAEGAGSADRQGGETAPLLLYLEGYSGAGAVYDSLRCRLSAGSVLVLSGIRRSASARRLWCRLQKDTNVGAMFDLYDYGIVFFEPLRNNQHYIINF